MMDPPVQPTTPLDGALLAASHGIPVLPVEPATASGVILPLAGWDPERATADRGTVRAWWAEHPRAGVALVAGHAGVDAISVRHPTLTPWQVLHHMHRNQHLGVGPVLQAGAELTILVTCAHPWDAKQPRAGLRHLTAGALVPLPPSHTPTGHTALWRRPLDPEMLADVPDWQHTWNALLGLPDCTPGNDFRTTYQRLKSN